MSNTLIATVAFVAMAVASQASTIVKWGEPAGDVNIIPSGNAAGENPIGTNYSAVNAISPANGTGGYDLYAAGQTRRFYGAQSSVPGPNIVNNANAPSADHIQLVRNFGSGVPGTLTNMVAWQEADFLTTGRELESLSVSFQTRGSGGATNWFLLETSAGWYVSDQSYTSSSTANGDQVTWSVPDASTLTWSSFSEFGVAGGAGAADITDVKSIGLYGIGSASTTWAGTKTFYFEVTAVGGVVENQPPVANPQSVIVDKNSFVDITLTGIDPEGSNLTYSVEASPTNGVLTGTAPNLTYTPDTNYVGSDSFTFTVNDGETNSEPATVSISVFLTLSGAVWDGGGADELWSNPINWVGDVLPVSESQNVTFNVAAANENLVVNTNFTVGSGQTLLCNSAGGNLIFRIGDMGAAGELRFATGSTLDFDDHGFITEQGSVNQRVTFEPGATLSTWRYYSNVGFTNTFIANASGVISTVHCTDGTAVSLRTRGALVLDLTSYTTQAGDTFVVFDYVARNTSDFFSSVSVTDAGGTLVEGVDYHINYEYDQGGGDLAVAVVIDGLTLPDQPTIAVAVIGGSLSLSWEDGYTYNVLTNGNLTNPAGWGVATNSGSPVSVTIGGEPQLFYKLEYPLP